MPARQQETLVALGYHKQDDIETIAVDGDLWRLDWNPFTLVNPGLTTENDAGWIGKGHEFIARVFKSHKDVAFGLESHLTSQKMAWANHFCLGATAKTGTGPWVYTGTPADGVTDGLERDYFTFAQQIRPGGSSIIDEAFVGCAVESFLVELQRGPGLANSRITMACVGSGRQTTPSGLTIPAATSEHVLGAASAAITIIGNDYVDLKTIESLRWGFRNNFDLDGGFFPGSGVQDGFAVRGRIEQGTREAVLEFTVRLEAGSDELANLIAQTTGTAVITQTFDANETYTATFHKVAIQAIERGEVNGIVTIDVTCAPEYHASNGLLTVAATTNFDEIGEAA